MRKTYLVVLSFVISLFMLTACGKEPGSNLLALLGLGGGDREVLPAAVFTKQFGTTTTGSIVLFENDRDGKSQFLYTAAEVGAGGMITKIGLRHEPDVPAEVINQNVTIRMGHTSITGLGTTWAANVETGQGSLVTVLDNKTVTIPAGPVDAWFDITLDTPFNYNGIDNLVVEISRDTACTAAIDVTYFQAASARRAWARGNTPDIAGSPDYSATTATGADQYQPWMQFVFAGGDNFMRYTGSQNSYPFNTTPDNQRVQMLYTKDQINGSGYITGLGFICGGEYDPGRQYAMTVRLGHTSRTALQTDSWDANITVGDAVVVSNTTVFKITAGIHAGDVIWVPMTQNFNYNGTDNLVVDVNVTGADDVMMLEMENSGTATRAFGSSATIGGVDGTQYAVKFRFNGGTADVITSGGTGVNYPFSGANNNAIQHLYLATELGTEGSITGIALRLNANSIASSYGNFKVVLGTTGLSALDWSFSGNMNGDTTMFSATLTIPAGLKAGDWIEIPFSTSFNYSPARNLAVKLSAQQGSALNSIRGEEDAPYYEGRQATADNNTSDDVSGISSRLADIRLVIEQPVTE